MTIRKKIEKSQEAYIGLLEKFISKGGAVISDQIKEEALQLDIKIFNVRIPIDLLEQADALIKKRPGLSRNAWILEAILEKVKKDKED